MKKFIEIKLTTLHVLILLMIIIAVIYCVILEDKKKEQDIMKLIQSIDRISEKMEIIQTSLK